MKKIKLLTISIAFTHLLAASAFAATVDSTKPDQKDKTTSAKMAPKVPMAKTAPLAPGVKPYVHNRVNSTEAAGAIENECDKPRNPGDPEKAEQCYQRNSK